MSNLFDRPGNWAAPPAARKSVVRDGVARNRAPVGTTGTSSVPGGTKGGGKLESAFEMVKKYKLHIIIGVSLLAVVIAYRLYSRRATR